MPKFRVALTRDFHEADGTPKFRDFGLSTFDGQQHVETTALAEHLSPMSAEQLRDANGAIVLTPAVTAESLRQADNLLAIGRFGVGYDAVDVPACSAADVVLFIARGAVDRSVAEATLTWMLALTHHVRIKDRLVRTGAWNDRTHYMGSELRDRTLGIIGLGGIGRALLKLVESFGMNQPIAFDPFLDAAAVAKAGARAVSLDELLQTADFVSIHCPLSPQTRNLLGARELGLMKPAAYLLNTARGGIVNEDALFAALQAGAIAGAALDCFDDEPILKPHRFGALDNVILAPHSIAWTNEMFRDIGRCVCQQMLDVSLGRRPHGAINPEVFDKPSFQAKWKRVCERIG